MTSSTPKVFVDAEVRQVIDLHQDLFTEAFRQLSVRDQLDRQAERLVQAHQKKNPAMAVHVQCWHPQWVGHAANDILSYDFTLDDARETLAREYGFSDWAQVEDQGTKPPDPIFEAAVDALLAGEVSTLKILLEEHPQLVHARSPFGHRATLLHYAGINGVETHRQVVPMNLAEIVALLIQAGADVNALADMYGGQCTPIALLITSAYPAEAGVVDEVVHLLKNAGAMTDD